MNLQLKHSISLATLVAATSLAPQVFAAEQTAHPSLVVTEASGSRYSALGNQIIQYSVEEGSTEFRISFTGTEIPDVKVANADLNRALISGRWSSSKTSNADDLRTQTEWTITVDTSGVILISYSHEAVSSAQGSDPQDHSGHYSRSEKFSVELAQNRQIRKFSRTYLEHGGLGQTTADDKIEAYSPDALHAIHQRH